MKMVLKTIFIVVGLLSQCSVYAKVQYNPTDYQKFENTSDCPNCNLSDAPLYGSHQNANISGANLSGAIDAGNDDYTESNFSNVKGMQMSFISDDLSQVNFSNAVLLRANFENSNLSYTDFTNANVQGVHFNKAILYGAKITAAQLLSAASVCDAILPDGSTGKCNNK